MLSRALGFPVSSREFGARVRRCGGASRQHSTNRAIDAGEFFDNLQWKVVVGIEPMPVMQAEVHVVKSQATHDHSSTVAVAYQEC
jgi:hypothetical protein